KRGRRTQCVCYAVWRLRLFFPRETEMDVHDRGVIIHFNDGTRMSLSFPRQTENIYAAQMKLEDVLKRRYALFEVDGSLLVVPFENVKYLQLHPAPAEIPDHTYVRGAPAAD